MRAVADNPDLAASSGIDVDRVIRLVWVVRRRRWPPLGGDPVRGQRRTCNFEQGFRLLLLMFAGDHPRRARHGLRRPGRRLRRRPVRQGVDAVDPDRAQERRRARRADPRAARAAAGHPRPGGTDRVSAMDWDLIFRQRRDGRRSGRSRVVYALAAIGLNMHFGYTGLLNFGQVGVRGGRRVRRRRRASHLRPVVLGAASSIGLVAAIVLAAAARASRPCGCAPTTSPSSRSRPARSCASSCARCATRHTLGGTDGLQTSPAASSSSTRSRTGEYGFWIVKFNERDAWVLIVRVGARRAVLRSSTFLADAQPVGPGPQGDPRGRGRGAQPRQERLLVQDAEPRPRRIVRRARRLRVRDRRSSR